MSPSFKFNERGKGCNYMPVMDGLEAIKRIRANQIPGKSKIPIITFSAGVMDKDKQTAMEAGANDILGKPFKVNILHQKIVKNIS